MITLENIIVAISMLIIQYQVHDEDGVPVIDLSGQKKKEDVNLMKEDHSELDALRKKVQEHEHYVALMKWRSVQCLSAMTKFKSSFMQEGSQSYPQTCRPSRSGQQSPSCSYETS